MMCINENKRQINSISKKTRGKICTYNNNNRRYK